MDPLSAGANLLGGIVSSVGSMINNAANIRQQNKTMQWQEQMSNTAHTREVGDLRNAGLNPILSATGGKGASTGSVGLPQQENPLAGVGAGISSAGNLSRADVVRLKNETDVARATVREKDASAGELIGRTPLHAAGLELIPPQIEKLKQEVKESVGRTGAIPYDMFEKWTRSLLNVANQKLSTASAKQAGAQTKTIEATRPGQEAKSDFWSGLGDLTRGDLPRAYSASAHRAASQGGVLQTGLGDAAYNVKDWWNSLWSSPGDAYGKGRGNAAGGNSSAKQFASPRFGR